MALSESDKDRIAAIVHRASEMYRTGDLEFWSGGEPEREMDEFLAHHLNDPEESAFALALQRQRIAAIDGHGPDPILAAVDAAEARGESHVRREGVE